MKKLAIFTQIAFVVMMVLLPVLVLATHPGGLHPGTSPFTGTGLTLANIQTMITAVARFLILISVIIAVIFIVWGGIMYMMAGDDTTKSTAAKSRIVNGIIGALVVLAVGLILQTLAAIVNWETFFVVP